MDCGDAEEGDENPYGITEFDYTYSKNAFVIEESGMEVKYKVNSLKDGKMKIASYLEGVKVDEDTFIKK